MTQGLIANWANAAQASTLGDLLLLENAGTLLAGLDGLDPRIAEQLRSGTLGEVQAGIEALRQNAVLLKALESGLPAEAAQTLVRQTAAFRRPAGAARERFTAETKAARQSSTILQYALARLRDTSGSDFLPLAAIKTALGRTEPRTPTSRYDYDPSRVAGHTFAHAEAPVAATSAEGRAQWLESRGPELERLRAFVSGQLDGSSPEIRSLYQDLRGQVIGHHEPLREKWDALVLAMRSLGNMPNFQTVSEAYWRRDEAIRKNLPLRLKGFGPWEYDLYRERSRFQILELSREAGPRDRMKFYGGEFAYALRAICSDYARIEQEADTAERERRLKALETDRFRMERAFMRLAQDQGVSREDAAFLDDIRKRYLPFLAEGLSGVDTEDIERLDRAARAEYEDYSRRLYERHVALAPAMLDLFMEEQKRIYEIDRLEEQWQTARYRDLIARGNIGRGDRRRFEAALKDYTATYAEYHAFAEGMLNGDPKKREFERNSKYRAVFISLWNLHDTVKDILGDQKLEILTFAFKTQAQFIARGPQGMAGLEPIAEITGRLAPVLDRFQKTIYPLPELYKLAGRDWGSGQLSHYVKNVHVVGAQKLIGYFAQDVRPETMMLEGAAELYPAGFTQLKEGDFAHRAGVRRALHLGQLEFSEAMGLFYQLGFGHVSILAQAGVGNFPVAGPFLYGLDKESYHHLGSGALLDRGAGGSDKHAAFTREINVGMGNNVNVYDSGTRDAGSPIASPYADFAEVPEAVHLPEYHGTRYNTGMSLKLAQDMGVPVIPVAYNLDQVYPEPSMPMPSNFADNFNTKSPRRILNKLVKSYGGFWNDRTMLRYVRPGQDDIVVAYGDVLTPESLVRKDDLPSMMREQDLSTLIEKAEKKAHSSGGDPHQARDKALRWQTTLFNTAAANFYERVAGYMATAGLYGRRARAGLGGRTLLGAVASQTQLAAQTEN